jgi:uncharacterized pyridoxal phosphate-containing UPF0001 family protein
MRILKKSFIITDKLFKSTFSFANNYSNLPRLRLRGLMALPAPCQDFEQQRIPFRALHTVYQQLQISGLAAFDTLSMGMTNDMEAAIAEGATL